MPFNWDLKRYVVEDYIKANQKRYPGRPEAEVLAQTLRDCGYIYFGNGNPAKECMDRFLGKKAGIWEFELSALVNQDNGVRLRLFSECIRRCLGLLTVREASSSGLPLSPSGGRQVTIPGIGILRPEEIDRRSLLLTDPIITLFQKNYAEVRWNGALGTFPVHFCPTHRSDNHMLVRLEGENQYDWHPDDNNRGTQELHRIAKRLIDLGAAKPFLMRAKPMMVSIDTRSLSIQDVTLWLSAVQANPSFPKTNGMIDRWLKKRF